MALINIQSAMQRIIRQAEQMEPGQGIEILSYKRNRGVTLIRTSTDLKVIERGYREEEWQIPLKNLAKLLKSIIKIEFPRSRKVRIYQLASPEEAHQERKKL